ncbi:hypothetical protein KKE34_01420, partial [Patescibacteria group bacterium]|nr:hypothetical protein [Patescibacteria group bacterium]
MNQNISAEVSHKVTQREYSAVTARNIGLFLLALSTPSFASCGTLPAPTPEAPGEDAGDDGVAQEGRVEAPTVTEAEELAEKPAPTVTEVDEPTLEPTLVPLENADSSVDRFGPSGIGKLTEVAEFTFEDPAAVIESILENLKVAMLSAGEDPSGVIWEEVSIQAPQLVGTEGQGK